MTFEELIFSARHVAYSPDISKELGSITQAVLISYLARWCNHSEDQWSYRTQSEIEWDTGMSVKQQRNALRQLRNKNLVLVERRGNPARNFYFVNVAYGHNKMLPKGTSRSDQRAHLSISTTRLTTSSMDETEKGITEWAKPYQEVMDSWNEFATANGLPKVRAITDKRKAAIRQRYDSIWPEINKLYARIKASDHCMRRDRRTPGDRYENWIADFDFLWLRTDTWVKLLEGKFDNRRGNTAVRLG